MNFLTKSLAILLIVIALGVLLTTILLGFGVLNLINPDVPSEHLVQNTLVCMILIFTGLVSIYAFFRPYSGGFFLLICTVVLSFIFGGFFRNPITYVVLLFGVLSVIRGGLSRWTPPVNDEQAS
jgi:hypothetical protein